MSFITVFSTKQPIFVLFIDYLHEDLSHHCEIF